MERISRAWIVKSIPLNGYTMFLCRDKFVSFLVNFSFFLKNNPINILCSDESSVMLAFTTSVRAEPFMTLVDLSSQFNRCSDFTFTYASTVSKTLCGVRCRWRRIYTSC